MADNEKRTREELLNPDYNYYIFFRIEPNEKDVDKIEKAILLEKNKWTQGQPIQRRYKELYPDVESVMIKDEGGARATELANAKKLKLGEAVRLITTMANNKGRLYKSELQQIVSSEKIQWFTLADLETEAKALAAQGVRYIDDSQSVIDFRKYKEVEKYLVTVKKDTLYAAIDSSPTDSAATLQAKVTSAYSELRKKKINAETAAMDKLLGIAKSLFASDESRDKYNEYLAIKKDVWDEMALRQSYGIKEISLDEFLDYAEKMKAILKMDIDTVELQLAAGLKEFKIIVVGTGNVIDLEICPYPECGRAYRVHENKPVKSCPHCGNALEILCWNCGGKMPFTTKSKTCPTCSCTMQSKTMFDTKVAEVDKVVRQPGCSSLALQSALTNLKNVVPNYKSHTGSAVFKKIAEYEKVVTDKINEEETTGKKYKADVEKIQAQIALKHYQQAQSMALTLRKNFPTYNQTNTTGLIGDINKVLAQAQTHVQQAKTYITQRNEGLAVATAAKALEICTDHIEARQILQKYPPAVPANLKVTLSPKNIVRIEWAKTGSQDMTTYTVIKKIGSKPAGPKDGTVLETNLSINFYEDANIVAATPYYYAVYAERCEITSNIVTSDAPVEVYLDVTNVRQEVVSDAIVVKWDSPHNVKAVEVWKKAGPIPPMRAGDGTRVQNVTLEGVTDTSCAVDSSYLILCQYEVNGVKKYSRGISRIFKQYKPLPKVGKFDVIPLPTGEFKVKGSVPDEAKLSFVCTKDRLTCRLDTVLQTMDFNKLCKNVTVVDVSYDADQNVVFTLPQNQILWVYPMISNEQLFTLSAPILLNTLAGIRNVSFTENNGTVLISGVLDAGIKNIIVKVSERNFALSLDDDGDKLTISKDRFDAERGASVKLKADTMSYITVFTEIVLNGQTTYTRAVLISDNPIGTLRKKKVRYAVDFKGSTTKKYTVTIKFAAEEEVEIPTLCLVKGKIAPAEKSAGELVEKINGITLKKGFFGKEFTGKVSVTVPPAPLTIKYRLFVDDDRAQEVQLRPVVTL